MVMREMCAVACYQLNTSCQVNNSHMRNESLGGGRQEVCGIKRDVSQNHTWKFHVSFLIQCLHVEKVPFCDFPAEGCV